jgi:hypothetical protein
MLLQMRMFPPAERNLAGPISNGATASRVCPAFVGLINGVDRLASADGAEVPTKRFWMQRPA